MTVCTAEAINLLWLAMPADHANDPLLYKQWLTAYPMAIIKCVYTIADDLRTVVYIFW